MSCSDIDLGITDLCSDVLCTFCNVVIMSCLLEVGNIAYITFYYFSFFKPSETTSKHAYLVHRAAATSFHFRRNLPYLPVHYCFIVSFSVAGVTLFAAVFVIFLQCL